MTPSTALRVVHQIPGRVRLRSHGMGWSADHRLQLAEALRRTPGVQSFRMAPRCDSVTVHHSAPLNAVIASAEHALAPPAAAQPTPRPPKRLRTGANRSASRRLLACAVIGFVIALLPEPVAPAMLALRFLVFAVTAAVRYHAETQVQPPALARWLDALSFIAGLARAEHLVRALVMALMKRGVEAQLRRAIA